MAKVAKKTKRTKPAMTRSQAVILVQKLLLKWFAQAKQAPANTKCSIHLWKTSESYIGIRVAEVSCFSHAEGQPDWAGSGWSYMAGDPDGLAICAATERFLIALMLGPGAEGWPEDHIAEAHDDLRFMLFGPQQNLVEADAAP